MRLGVALAVSAVGCFTKPSLRENDGDPPTVHLIGNAYFSDPQNNGGTGSPGMSKTEFSISTSGIVDGDLVLFIANVDSGSNTIWPRPDPDFAPLQQRFFGGDAQTVYAAWAIANNEPATYGGDYGPGGTSGAATISLVAVRGASPTAPGSVIDVQAGAATAPPTAVSSGLVTSAEDSMLIYAAGADWQSQDDVAVFTPPAGFTTITALGDHGTSEFQWTTQQLAFAHQGNVGETGPISGTIQSDQNFGGNGWAMLFAFAPAD